MNKGRRNELTNLKFKKRLAQLGLKKENGNMFAYKSHGKPCSCSLCRNQKYNRNKKINEKSNLNIICSNF